MLYFMHVFSRAYAMYAFKLSENITEYARTCSIKRIIR